MRLTVFGASGGVGQQVVRLALARGDQVRAVFRTTPALQPATNLEIVVVPTLLDAAVVAGVVQGADAVVSALGLRRRYPRNPFSALTSPPDFTSTFAELFVNTVGASDMPRRVVAVSAAGVGESWDTMSWPLRTLFGMSTIGVAYRNLARMEAIFRRSSLDWTCVRPTTLTDGPLTERVALTDVYTMMSRISRADVAWFLLRAAGRPGNPAERTPMIRA